MKTIFINKLVGSPTISLIKSLNTISVNTDENIKSDYIFFNEYPFNDNLDYCIRHNLSSNYTSLINKHIANQIYNNYNFSTLPTVKPLQLSDVENLEGDKFFIKPVIGSGTNKFFNIPSTLLAQAYYTPINKQSILDIFSVENSSFWDTQIEEHSGFILQNFISSGIQNNFYIQYGCINGNGNVYFCNPVIGTKTIMNGRFNTISTYSEENITDEILDIQMKIQAMLLGENIKNCPFNMQFLLYNNKYVPIDFNFRLGHQEFYIDTIFSELNWCKSLIEYTYDISNSIISKPPISTALNIFSVPEQKTFSYGQTRQEALDNLNNLIN